jgi:hypothetical protein
MILMWGSSILRAIGRGRPKSRFSGPTPSNGPRNGCTPLIIMAKPHIKNRYIGNFMYLTRAAGVCVTLCIAVDGGREGGLLTGVGGGRESPPPNSPTCMVWCVYGWGRGRLHGNIYVAGYMPVTSQHTVLQLSPHCSSEQTL